MDVTFTLAEARALMPEVLARAERIVALRADLTVARDQPSLTGPGLPEIKSMEAHLQEAVDWFGTNGVQVKGLAPLLVDFPSELDGEPVLLCWLENEPELSWYHPLRLGFMARRRLPAGL